MGLGKTVMTIALILARQGRGDNICFTRKRKLDSHTNTSFQADGGTLIVCPMALLGQWKVSFNSIKVLNQMGETFNFC